MSFRRSRPLWSYEEVVALINIWEENNIQDVLKGTVKNYHVYDIIASKLKAKGFYRTAIQCRIKVKNLKAEYRAAQALDPLSRECRPSARYMHLLEKMFGPKSECESPTMDPLDASNHASQQRNSDGSSSPSDLQLVNVFHLGNSNPYFSESLQWQPVSKDGIDSSHNEMYVEHEKSSPSSEEMEYQKDNEDNDDVKSSEGPSGTEKFDKPLSSKTRKELHTLKVVMQTITSQFLHHQETAEHRFYDFERERMQYEAEMEDKRMEFLREEMERQSRDEERREMRMMQVLERMLACFERLKRGNTCNLDEKT